jgi:hypothetical protein
MNERGKAKAKRVKNFIEAHALSKCGGSYRKGVVFDASGVICRIFINFTTSKLDKHSENYNTIFYAGRGKKDKDKYFIEDTVANRENLRMEASIKQFPIYVKNGDGYFYVGQFVISKAQKKKQFNPNMGRYFATMGFLCRKISD